MARMSGTWDLGATDHIASDRDGGLKISYPGNESETLGRQRTACTGVWIDRGASSISWRGHGSDAGESCPSIKVKPEPLLRYSAFTASGKSRTIWLHPAFLGCDARSTYFHDRSSSLPVMKRRSVMETVASYIISSHQRGVVESHRLLYHGHELRDTQNGHDSWHCCSRQVDAGRKVTERQMETVCRAKVTSGSLRDAARTVVRGRLSLDLMMDRRSILVGVSGNALCDNFRG